MDARATYLRRVIAQRGLVPLPVGDDLAALPLDAVFQPLRLRSDPSAPEDQPRRMTEADAEANVEANDQPAADVNERRRIVPSGRDALAGSPARRLVILGGPGAGKTTILRDLLVTAARAALADPAAPLPVWIALPDLARLRMDLPALTQGIAVDAGLGAEFGAALVAAITTGSALLCLDSLDEVAPADRPAIIAFLNAGARDWGGAWIVGSRFTDYKGGQLAHGRFAEWEVQPLDDALRLELARRLLPALRDALAPETSVPDPEAFVAQLASHPRAAEWGANPLLFSLAAVAALRSGGLPASRSDLYHAAIAGVLATRASDPADRDHLLTLTMRAARRLYVHHGRAFSGDDLRAALADEADPDGAARRVLASGALEVLARATYAFRHQTLQEYLVGADLAADLASDDPARRDAAWDLAWSKRTYSRWNEPLRLLVGELARRHGAAGVEQARRWLAALLAQADAPDGDPGHLCLTLAVMALAELAPPLPPDLVPVAADAGARWATAVLHWRKRSDGPHSYNQSVERKALLVALAGGAPEVGATIGRAILAEIPGVLYAVTFLDDLGATLPLVVALEACEQIKEKRAVLLLAHYGDIAPLEQLQTWAASGPIWQREAAIEVLGKLEDRVPLDRVISLLDDPDVTLVAAAIQAFGQRIPAPRLLAMLDHPQLSVHSAAMVALGDRAPLDRLVAMLAASVKQNYPLSRRLIIENGDRLPLETLEQLLKHNYQVYEIVEVLGRRVPFPGEMIAVALPNWKAADMLAAQGTEWLPLLLPLLAHASRLMRYEVSVALINHHLPVPAELLIPPLLDAMMICERYPEVFLGPGYRSLWEGAEEDAAETLLKLGRDVHDATLIEALATYDPDAMQLIADALVARRCHAAWPVLLACWRRRGFALLLGSLAALDPEMARPVLWSALVGTQSEAIALAASELGRLPEAPSLAAMLAEVVARDGVLRWRSLQVLARLEQGAGSDEATTLLDDPDGAIAVAAMRLLVAGNMLSADRQVRFLDDDRPAVWQGALQLLTPLADQLDRANIDALAHHHEATIRGTALNWLAEIGDPAALSSLLMALNDTDPIVRRRAIALAEICGAGAASDVFWRALDDPDREVCQTALRVLVRRDPVTLAARFSELIAVYATSSETERINFANVVPDLAGQLHLPALFHLLDDPRPAVRATTLRVMLEIGTSLPMERIVRCLDDDTEVVEAALMVLARHTPEQYVQSLASIVSKLSPSARTPIYASLQIYAGTLSLDMILAILRIVSAQNSKSIVQIIARSLDVPTLGMLLAHQQPDIALTASLAIWERPNLMPRAWLQTALTNIGNSQAYTLMEILFTPEKDVSVELLLWVIDLTITAKNWKRIRASALEALAAHPDPAANEVLVARLAGDPETYALPLARRGLQAIPLRRRYGVAAEPLIERNRAAALVALPYLDALYLGVQPPGFSMVFHRAIETFVQLDAPLPIDMLMRVLDVVIDKEGNGIDYNGSGFVWALRQLRAHYPAEAAALRAECLGMLRGQGAGAVFGSLARQAAANALGSFGQATADAYTLLAPLLDDPDSRVRRAAMQACGTLRRNAPDDIVRALYRRRTGDADGQARDAADAALADILAVDAGLEDD